MLEGEVVDAVPGQDGEQVGSHGGAVAQLERFAVEGGRGIPLRLTKH